MHGDGGQPQLVVVGVRHVLAGELRDGVRPARLADRADRRDLPFADVVGVGAEHLARREVDEPLERPVRRERRLERVVGADHVHPHRPHRALEHRLDAGDRGAVDEVRRAVRELHQLHPRRGRPPGGASKFGCSARSVPVSASRCRLSTATIAVALDELPGERRRDEAGAAGDEDPLTLEHAGEAYVRPVRAGAGPGAGPPRARRPRPGATRAGGPAPPARTAPAASRAWGRRAAARAPGRGRRAARPRARRTRGRPAAARAARRRAGVVRPGARRRAAAEPAMSLVDEIELDRVPPRLERRAHRHGDDGARSGRQIVRERRPESIRQALVGEPDLGQAVAAVRPGLGAEVRHAHVEAAHLPRRQRVRRKRLDRGPVGALGQRPLRPHRVDLGPRRRRQRRRVAWRRPGRRQHQVDQRPVGRGDRRDGRVARLGDVEGLVQRASADAQARPHRLVAPRLALPRPAVARQQVEVIERRLEVASRAGGVHRDVDDARENDRVAAGEPQLPVGPPREGVEPAVAPEPAAGDEAVRHVAGRRRQHVEERLRRHLVVVDPEDPVAGGLLVQPAQRALDRVGVRRADHPVGERRERPDEPRIDPVVDGDHDLAGDRAEHRRRRHKPVRNTAQAADREHRETIRVPRRGQRLASRGP